MLQTPTPFPQVGSYALLEEDGRHQLVRIQKRIDDEQAVISFPLVPAVASGNRTVAVEQLIDGTPLTAAERQRLDKIKNHRVRRGLRAEADALRSRDIHARQLADLMARLPARARPGSATDGAA